MKAKNYRRTWRGVATRVAAGSLTGAVVVALLTPFNMGGCSAQQLTGGLNSATGGLSSALGGGGGGGGGTGNQILDLGVAGFGAVQALSMGDKDERAMGQSVALSLTNRYGTVQDEQVNKYVTMVAQTLVNTMKTGGQVYVAVLDTDEMNAYAGPHGYVFVTKGALKAMDDEAELAAVLGHEIAHVYWQHGLRSAKDAKLGAAFFQGTSAAVGRGGSQWVNAAAPIIDKVATSVYSQDQERQSDGTALVLASRAGYDPNGFSRFLEKLRARQSGGAKLFSTHPGVTDRIRNANSVIARERLTGRQTNAARFKQNVLDRLR